MAPKRDSKSVPHLSLRKRLLYSAIPSLLLLVLIELGARISLLLYPDSWSVRFEAYLHNPAYTSKPWFSREFLRSSLSHVTGYYSPPGHRFVLLVDYKDRFFTIRDGVRATIGFDPSRLRPGQRVRKLFLIGGSTTYCAEVPDELTYPSQLQKLLAANSTTQDIEVLNYGMTSVNSTQEVDRLEYELGRNNIPDFCIFLDGFNDVYQGIVNGNPHGTMYQAQQDYNGQGFLITLKRLARASIAAQKLYNFVLKSQRQNNPVQTRSEAKVRELAEFTADLYEQNLLRAKKICDQHQIALFVFLQPHLFAIQIRPWTDHERAIAQTIRESQGNALQVCYPLLHQRIQGLRQQGIGAYDISDLFEDNVEPIFLDEVHVESTGNRLIAQAILKHALPVLSQSSGLSSRGP